MKITLRYFDGDPNWGVAEERIAKAIEATGLTGVNVELVKVESTSQAHELKFRGSPTILIDGFDHFDSEETGYGLTCRVYRTQAGMDGSPSLDQLIEVLKKASAGSA